MTRKWSLFAVIAVLFCGLFTSCTKIETGYIGLRVSLLGDEKGSIEEVSPGYYVGTVNKQYLAYPAFVQYAVWTEDCREKSKTDEALRFQSSEGLAIVADVGMDYMFSSESGAVARTYAKYRKDPQEIADVTIRNRVREALVKYGSEYTADSIISNGKVALMESVFNDVKNQFAPDIVITGIYWLSDPRPPQSVTDALNAKVQATQIALQRENEVKTAEAEAKKVEAQAQGEANAILIKAKAQAEANKIIAASLTSNLVESQKIEKWDGHLPTVSGGGNDSMIIDMRNSK